MQDVVSLSSVVIEHIQRDGPLSFRDFMELALYHPELGYYSRSPSPIGADGDYYTSAFLTGMYGELLAVQLEEMWRVLGKRDFTIVEYGAGTGLLCRDILFRLKQQPELYEKLDYIIIERSAAMRARERGILPGKVKWAGSIGEIGPVRGCVLSNELVDNFSVHRVVMEEELMEVCVDYDGGFKERLRPAPDVLCDYLVSLGVDLPRGYRAEVCLEATKWIQEVGAALEKGWIITVDYGYPAAVLYSRRSGTLACYHRHQVHHCPYEWIGEQDITCHVNFSALDHWGRRQGLETCGFTSQGHFLQALGLTAQLRTREVMGICEGDRLALRVFLTEMGQKFKVLIQRKGVEPVYLSGLRFAEKLG
jgi:SAM-dependent MidA family methyltransferase